MGDEPAREDAAADEGSGAGEEAPIEELSPEEEASSLEEAVAAVRARRRELDAIPDGPRPRVPGESYKRRQMFVDWELQVSYVGVYLTVTVFLVIGFAALNYVFAAFYERAAQVQLDQPYGEGTDYFLLATLNVVFLLLLVIGMAVYAIIQSHRIAGPVFRFRRALEALHGRDYDFHLQLRERDYMKDVAEQLNALNQALKAKDVAIADAALALDELARRHPSLAADLSPVTATLGELILPEEEPPPQD